jgi:hypothetical protein
MNLKELTRDQIFALRDEMEKKLIEANKNKGDIEDFIFCNFEVPAREKLVGKCYSYGNSFGGGSDIPPWTEYIKINSYDEEHDMFAITTIYDRVGETCIKNCGEYAGHYDKDSCITRKMISTEEFENKLSEIKASMFT